MARFCEVVRGTASDRVAADDHHSRSHLGLPCQDGEGIDHVRRIPTGDPAGRVRPSPCGKDNSIRTFVENRIDVADPA